MIALSVNISQGKIAATIGRVAPEKRREALSAIGQFLVSSAKDNIAGRRGPDGAWPTSASETSFASPRIWQDIAQSVQFEVVADDSLAVGATHIAAAVRQLGTVGAGGTLPDIVPTKKKALTIPVDPAASRASYEGIDARTAFPTAFVLKPEHGASPLNVGVLARWTGGRTNRKTGVKENQQLQILYLLVRSVAIRAHPFLPFDAAGNIAPPAIWDEIVKLIQDVYVGGAA